MMLTYSQSSMELFDLKDRMLINRYAKNSYEQYWQDT
jgi:hypothetical protein